MQDINNFQERIQSDDPTRHFLNDSSTKDNIIVTRAPGRLDIMGGVADYSGALVAEATIAEAAIVGLRKREDRCIRFWSLGIAQEGFDAQAEYHLVDFYRNNELLSYQEVHANLTSNPETRWAAYLAGCFFVLLAEQIVPEWTQGANILLESRVPLGAGVSSSAAIEVATMQAINIAYSLNLDGAAIATLAQKVENHVVGAPCGIMDQMTSALGAADSLLLLLCRPHQILGTRTWPDSVRFYGINSNRKHSVGGSAYTRARVAAFMGRKLLGAEYLAQVAPLDYQERFYRILPDEISGSAFLEKYGETGDTVTRIDPATTYPIREATEHAIYEHDRVVKFTELIAAPTEANLISAGQLMYQSHDSYTRIGLGCAETDMLVELARRGGEAKGIFGAKITGGGSGGTVAFLTSGSQAAETLSQIAAVYSQSTGLKPQTFEAGKSPGAIAFGSRQIEV